MSGSNAFRARAGRLAIGLAAGGVLAGHGVTYAIVHPDAHERAGLLAATGHAYLHLLEGPGAALAIASVIAAALVGLGRLGPAPDRRAVFRRLAAIQASAFVGLELAERIASGASPVAGDAPTLMALGVVLQLLLAAGGAWLLDTLRRSAERLVAAFPGDALRVPRASFVRPLAPIAGPALAPSLAPDPGRGPPSRRR